MKNKLLIFLILIIVFHCFMILKLIFFPYPEFFVYPYLTNNGLIPYKQIFDQHFPGLMFLPLNFDNLGMKTPQIARLWLMGIIALTHLELFWISRKIFKNNLKALLPNLIYLLWQPFLEGWVLWIDNFLPLFYLPAFYFLYQIVVEKNNQKVKFFLTGLFMGLGLIFKQVGLPLAVVILAVIYINNKKFEQVKLFLLGFLPLPLVLLAYLFQIGAMPGFWYWTIWFNLTTFAQYGRKAPSFGGLIKVLGVFLPVIFILSLKNSKTSILLIIFILGSLGGAFNRFDFVHFQPAIPFLAIILSFLVLEKWKTNYFRIFIAGYLLVTVVWLGNFYRGNIGNKIYFYDEETLKIAQAIEENSKPKEEIFLFGVSPHLYQLSQTLPAGQIFVFQFPWFIMKSEGILLDALQKNPPELIVSDRTVEIEGQKITEYAKRLDWFIERNYVTFEKIGNVELKKKK